MNHTDATREKLRAASMGNPQGRAQFQKLAAARVVVFTDDMRRVAAILWRLGRHQEHIAAVVGVSREVLRRNLRAMGLGNRRHIPGFYRHNRRA